MNQDTINLLFQSQRFVPWPFNMTRKTYRIFITSHTNRRMLILATLLFAEQDFGMPRKKQLSFSCAERMTIQKPPAANPRSKKTTNKEPKKQQMRELEVQENGCAFDKRIRQAFEILIRTGAISDQSSTT